MGCSKNWSHIAHGVVAETSGEISPLTKQCFDTFEFSRLSVVCLSACLLHAFSEMIHEVQIIQDHNLCGPGVTVKAGTQQRGMERGTEINHRK